MSDRWEILVNVVVEYIAMETIDRVDTGLSPGSLYGTVLDAQHKLAKDWSCCWIRAETSTWSPYDV